MSSFVLKIIAMVAMTMDHLNYVIYDHITWLNYIGRLAFPIFAWQIVVGFEKTRDVKKYIFRLFVLAIISQPFFYLLFGEFMSVFTLNTIFTLLFGLLCLCALKKSEFLGLLVTLATCMLSEYVNFDYGSFGILMIVIFYLFRNNKGLMVLFQLANLGIYQIFHPNSIEMYSFVAILLILLYNGKRGYNVKYLFYIFYPLHLLILYILSIYI